jgi:hypothetical protein
MVVLVATRLVQRVSVGSVRQGRAFTADRRLQDLERRHVNPLPLLATDTVARFFWVDAGLMENLRSIQVTDPGNRLLIQEGNLDGSATSLQSITHFAWLQCQGVGPHTMWTKLFVKFFRREQPHVAQSASIPIPNVADVARKIEPKSQMFRAGRVGQQDKPSHARLEYNPIATVQEENDPFSHATNFFDRSIDRPAAKQIDSRMNFERFQSARQPNGVLDPSSRNAQDTPTHCFDFWQFWHVALCFAWLNVTHDLVYGVSVCHWLCQCSAS